MIFWLPVPMLYPHNLFLCLFFNGFRCVFFVWCWLLGVDVRTRVMLNFLIPTPTCQEEQQPSVEPGSVHPKTTTISCIPCDHGWFSNHDISYRCQKCTTCGNKGVHVNCSIYKDAVCSKSCKSKTHYFNESDGQCYACTECRGKDESNIERQCLLSSGNLRVVCSHNYCSVCAEVI